MEELKECLRCEIVKPLDAFSINKTNKDGSITTKPNCKSCEALKAKQRYAEKNKLKSEGKKVSVTQKAPVKKTEGIQRNKSIPEGIKGNTLSNVDIDGIREILKYKDIIIESTKGIQRNKSIPKGIKGNTLSDIDIIGIQEILKYKDIIIENTKGIQRNAYVKGERKKATYSIDETVKILLTEYCDTKLCNKSDIVNMAILQYLEQGNTKE